VLAKRNFREDGDAYVTTARGVEVLETPLLNKGTAFTPTERVALGLEGLLPPAALSLDEQAERAYAQLHAQPGDLLKNVFLEGLHDRNEVLYYRVLAEHLRELLPIVYDPTVGEAIKRYSHEYRRPRGAYLSIDQPDQIEAAFGNLGLGPEDVDLLVASDAEEILGIGDWGTGAIVLGAAPGAVRVAGVPMREQRVVIFGAGTAGVGIADQLRDAMVRDGQDRDAATRRIWCVDRQGLLTDDMDDLRDFQVAYARPGAEVAGWPHDGSTGIGLAEVVARARQVSDGMLVATAEAVAGLVDVSTPGASLLPQVENLRAASATVAVAVAERADREGLAQAKLTDPVQQVQDAMWQPLYRPVKAASP
jgi:malic enzyme